MSAPPARRKLVLIGHTYCIAHNREKAAALSKLYDVTCIYPSGSAVEMMGQDQASFDASEEPEGTHVVHQLKATGNVEDATKQFYFGLWKLLNEIQPDIILCEAEPWAVARWQTAIWARTGRHRATFVEFTWENVRRPGFKGMIVDQFYKMAARTGDLVVCGNQAAKLLFIAAGKPADHCLVAPQLGNPDAGYPSPSDKEKQQWRQESGFPKDAFVIGYCGRFIPEKGLRELIEAVRRIRETDPKPKRLPVLAFLGAGDMQAEIEKETDGFGAILPPVPHQDVPHIMSHWDVLLLPSKPVLDGKSCWEEQFGRVLIEAMAAGVPALGSTSGAIPEVVKFDEAVFRHSDTDHLTEVLGGFVHDPESLADLLSRQNDYVTEECTHTRLAERYAAFIDAHV